MRIFALAFITTLALGGCGKATEVVTTPTSRATAATLGGVVSALQGSSLGVCKVDHTYKALSAQAGAALTVDCASSSPTQILVDSYASSDLAYTGAAFNYTPGSTDSWYVGDLAVQGLYLSATETSALNNVMRSAGATQYTG